MVIFATAPFLFWLANKLDAVLRASTLCGCRYGLFACKLALRSRVVEQSGSGSPSIVARHHPRRHDDMYDSKPKTVLPMHEPQEPGSELEDRKRCSGPEA